MHTYQYINNHLSGRCQMNEKVNILAKEEAKVGVQIRCPINIMKGAINNLNTFRLDFTHHTFKRHTGRNYYLFILRIILNNQKHSVDKH